MQIFIFLGAIVMVAFLVTNVLVPVFIDSIPFFWLFRKKKKVSDYSKVKDVDPKKQLEEAFKTFEKAKKQLIKCIKNSKEDKELAERVLADAAEVEEKSQEMLDKFDK